MSTVINTNLASLFAQNSLSNAQNNLATSVQRLSSGLRINSAKDDAAGLVIAQNMQGQINGVNQSIHNLSDATNLLQTADSSLATIQDMLLRMKQLSVQGYNGAINTTQKNAIVNELADLNAEINQTAQRTSFNGIKLLSNASGVDDVNGGVAGGKYLTTTKTEVNSTAAAAGSSGTAAVLGKSSSLTATNDLGTSATVNYAISLDNDDAARELKGTYTFTAVDDQVTLSVTSGYNNQVITQTLRINPAPYEDTSPTHDSTQTLDFDRFGITLDLRTNVPAAGGNMLGADIATAFNGANFTISGQASKITDLDVSGAAAGRYTFTQNTVTAAGASGTAAVMGSELTVAWTDAANNDHTEMIDLANIDFLDNKDSTVAFVNSGISFKIHNFQTQTGADIAGKIANLTDTQGEHAGILNITSDGNSRLDFQSGPTTSTFISINTLNVQTGASGLAEGSTSEMKALGDVISGSAGLQSLSEDVSDLAAWQATFKTAADAIDKALDFISTKRAEFGSQMNRLSFITSNLASSSTNLQNSRSSIIDTDFASETAKLTKGQIMQQAATAMLAQANQMPNVILSLLK